MTGRTLDRPDHDNAALVERLGTARTQRADLRTVLNGLAAGFLPSPSHLRIFAAKLSMTCMGASLFCRPRRDGQDGHCEKGGYESTTLSARHPAIGLGALQWRCVRRSGTFRVRVLLSR